MIGRLLEKVVASHQGRITLVNLTKLMFYLDPSTAVIAKSMQDQYEVVVGHYEVVIKYMRE